MTYSSSRLFIGYFIFLFFIHGCGGSGGGSSVDTNEGIMDTPVTKTPVVDAPDSETPNVAEPENTTQPNILFILSDDQGLDASAQYNESTDVPATPTLNALAEKGIVFENAWATPACTTTRGTILTGKYGTNSGVTYVPAKLSTEHEILQSYLKNNSLTSAYQSAVFGKWHLGGGNADASHPNDVGVDYYAGNLKNLDSYYEWDLTINGSTETSTEYHTSKITDLALAWINQQTSPWFAWVAYSAPHDPFHLPPADLHDRNLSGTADDISNNKREYYLASVEAMDSEIGRLLANLSDDELANTVIIFMGDNGTPRAIIDASNTSHSKGTLYQGGVAVPLVISGAGVERVNVRENALVTATDLYATIAEIAGSELTQVNDSSSFKSLLSEDGAGSNYVFTEFESTDVTGFSVRSQQYKFIEYEDGTQELFDVSDSFEESINLLPSFDSDIIAQTNALKSIGDKAQGNTSESPIGITNAHLTNGSGNCSDYVESYTSDVLDVHENTSFSGDLTITVSGNTCVFNTNAIPNHDFNDGTGFPNKVSEQNDTFTVTTTPLKAVEATELSLTVDNAILLNGVKVDLLAAACYGVGNEKIGCNDMDQPWRFDPMFAANGFAVDSHNAHAQPDGTYHYHGSPVALFSNNTTSTSPVVGFAADGFPIYGSYVDFNGTIRKVESSYQLKSGSRASTTGNPGGNYDGTYRDDYEYVSGSGDLDECNGMTVNGVYGYYITDGYPYVLACFSGTPDSSFNKNQ